MEHREQLDSQTAVHELQKFIYFACSISGIDAKDCQRITDPEPKKLKNKRLVDMNSPGSFSTGALANDKRVNYACKKFSRNAEKCEGRKEMIEFKVSKNLYILDYCIIAQWNPQIFLRGTLYEDRLHEKTANITIRDVPVWQASWKSLEVDNPKLPEATDNRKDLKEYMDDWVSDRDKFIYFPEGVVKCKCDEYHLELKGTNP